MPNGNNPIPYHVLNQRREQDESSSNEVAHATQTVTVAGAEIELNPEHVHDLVQTELHTVGVFPTYRRMTMEIIRWWQAKYPALYAEIVYEVSERDKDDKTKHYYKATHDIRYDLLDSKWVKLFISSEKKWKDKEKTKQYGYDHPRRYADAILKCASVSKYSLPQKYKSDMKGFLATLKLEKTKAKTNRQLSEQESDEIGIGLLEYIAECAVKDGENSGIYVWAFMTTQWNVMGRTVNVDPLGFHNLKKSQHDSIIIHYDSNKCDKKGENVTPKNCYANPSKPYISMFLALGCYLSIFQNKFKRNSDKLFQAKGKDGSASNTYSKALKRIINALEERLSTVREHCREGHFHPHGFRKGAGTHVTTCTMDPPPIPSVLMRGEWSLGKVLEVYWKYSMIGDTYLGRCLAGFDPDLPGFGVLPPHFKVGMENDIVREGMNLCFGGILEKFPGEGIEGALLLFLASIVYHAESFLLPIIAKSKKHAFLNIPILSRPDLLRQLEELVTLEPAGDVQQATGVPRHAKMMDELKDLYKMLQDYMSENREWRQSLPGIIKGAIDDKAAESGHVTAAFVMEQVSTAISNSTNTMEEKIVAAVKRATSQLRSQSDNNSECDATSQASHERNQSPQGRSSIQNLYPTYKYQDEHATKRNKNRTDWDVPVDFDLPQADLYVAWTAWLLGYPMNRSTKSDGSIYSAPVKPLHLLLREGKLPQKLKKKFDNLWRPTLELMHNEVASTIRTTSIKDRNDAFIKSTYDHALKNVCAKYPDLAATLTSGSRAVSTCSKAFRALNTKKRKAAHLNNN